mmetsp:Transcript_92139/g.264090  ORF Transcript_92139/g.264090 Transcript_92139/m.264090 type:complete len:259 (-) Transcript_92139:162-938(-)
MSATMPPPSPRAARPLRAMSWRGGGRRLGRCCVLRRLLLRSSTRRLGTEVGRAWGLRTTTCCCARAAPSARATSTGAAGPGASMAAAAAPARARGPPPRASRVAVAQVDGVPTTASWARTARSCGRGITATRTIWRRPPHMRRLPSRSPDLGLLAKVSVPEARPPQQPRLVGLPPILLGRRLGCTARPNSVACSHRHISNSPVPAMVPLLPFEGCHARFLTILLACTVWMPPASRRLTSASTAAPGAFCGSWSLSWRG